MNWDACGEMLADAIRQFTDEHPAPSAGAAAEYSYDGTTIKLAEMEASEERNLTGTLTDGAITLKWEAQAAENGAVAINWLGTQDKS